MGVPYLAYTDATVNVTRLDSGAPRHTMLSGQTKREIELWFEFGSNYSYLSVMRIETLTAAAGVKLVWCPFLLGPIFKSFGWETSPFVLQAAKGAYVWKDMQRQCEKYGLAWK